jgi:lipoprotein-anchoring transpeptidase ErfK/SrfK
VAAALMMVAGVVVVGVGTAGEPSASAAPSAAPTARPAPTAVPAASGRPAPAVSSAAAAAPAPAPAAGAPARTPSPAPAALPLPLRAPASAPAQTAPDQGAPAQPAPAPTAPDGTPLVAGTPCSATARACVDLAGRTAWLIDTAGAVRRGPVRIMTGDRDDPTPRGTFHVQWKAQEYTSREYLTQMPYSVFFADGGIAFHQGTQDVPSAGCVKLVREDAMAWFDFLQVGDQVQIH